MREALAEMNSLKALVKAGVQPHVARNVTLSGFLQRWLDDVAAATVRASTLRSYRGILSRHVMPVIGHVQIMDLTPANVAQLLVTLERANVSTRIRELAIVILRRALKQAIRWQMVDRNVAQLVDKPRVVHAQMQTWSPAQVSAFLETARADRLFALYLLALGTGMRQGELYALRWSDIDLDAAAIAVQYTLDHTSRELGEPKSRRGRRKIEISPSIVRELRAHRARMLAEGHPHGWVFSDSDGGALRAQNVYRRSFLPMIAMADAIARADGDDEGVPLVRFHDLRHTAATLMLGAGIHPKIVSERLGHATVAITLDVYSHVTPSMQREAALAIDRFFA